MNDEFEDWSTPIPCRWCRYPVGQEETVCPDCGGSITLLSKVHSFSLLSFLKTLCYQAVQGILFLSLAGLGLYVCFHVSMVVILLPLYFVFRR